MNNTFKSSPFEVYSNLEGEMSIKDMADKLDVTTNALYGYFSFLMKKGYVTRYLRLDIPACRENPYYYRKLVHGMDEEIVNAYIPRNRGEKDVAFVKDPHGEIIKFSTDLDLQKKQTDTDRDRRLKSKSRNHTPVYIGSTFNMV